MADWFLKPRYTLVKPKTKPEEANSQSQWAKCPSCEAVLYMKDLKANSNVCPSCAHHFRITSKERIALLCDESSFEEFNMSITSADPLEFVDASGPYTEKVARAIKKTGMNEGVVTGKAKIGGFDAILTVMDFTFLGGSMGSAVGEKIYRAIMKAHDNNIPLIIVSCSGGARMHEGLLSLMQMAKTSAALALLAEKKLPFISILTDPTTGGVTASFAMLGDVNIAEPNTLIGFAGARVIEQTIKEKLPDNFQKAEFLLEHGFIDFIVDRRQMKEKITKLLDFFLQ